MNTSALLSLASIEEATAEVAERLRRITVRLADRHGAAGSGVLWRTGGTIVTNAHVARGDRIDVHLPDGREVGGLVVARSRGLDLALVTIPLIASHVATSVAASTLAPGALVFAMGTPHGVPDALAIGIAHGAMRIDRRGRPLLIGADIRLAPGNSGGPLVNAAGHVVGINSMVVNGLGIAVASETVEAFVDGARVRAAA